MSGGDVKLVVWSGAIESMLAAVQEEDVTLITAGAGLLNQVCPLIISSLVRSHAANMSDIAEFVR